MAITKTTQPYEFLVRWTNGNIAGAHVRFLETISEDGTVLTQKEGNAMPVSMAGEAGFPLSDLLTLTQQTALAERDAALAAKATAEAALATATTAHTAALAAKDTHIATLQAQIDAYALPALEADPLGPVVDDLQIRLAMNQVGLRVAVENAIAASVDQSLKDWYERAKKFKRRDPLVLGMMGVLGVSESEADDLWALAATL